MLMILARLVRSESFWAVAKVRSPHTGPGISYIILRAATTEGWSVGSDGCVQAWWEAPETSSAASRVLNPQEEEARTDAACPAYRRTLPGRAITERFRFSA